MQNNICKAFVAALLAVAAFGVSPAAPGGAAPGMPRPPGVRPDGVAMATSVKTTTARLGSLRRDDTVVVAVEGVVADSGVDTNAVRAIVEEYCGTNIVPRVDAVESGLSDVEEWQRTNGLYSAVAELGDSVSAALAAKADGTVVERGVYSPAMDTNDVWVVDMDGTVLRFLDADPAAGTVTWRGVCASNTLWVSGSTTSAPPEVAYSLTTLETGAGRVLASVDVVDAATGARCGIPRSTLDGTGDDVAYLAPSYDQAGPGDLQYSYTTTVRPLGSGALVFHRTDSGALAEVVRLSRGRVVDAETSVVYDADLRRRLAELRAAVVSRDAATSGFTEWAVSAERPVTGEVVVAAFPAGSAPSGACDWSLFYADDAVRDDSTRLASVKRASSAATNLVWAASETSWGISVTACRVRVPTVADIEGVQAAAGKHYDDASAMFAKLLHYATNNYYSAYLANERAKNLEAWQYTNAVGRADVERGMTDWAMTPMWPIGYVDAGQVLDGPDAGKWSLFPTGVAPLAENKLLPAITGGTNSLGDVVALSWPDASWRVEAKWTNSLDKVGIRWDGPSGDYVTAHFDAKAVRSRVVAVADVERLARDIAGVSSALGDAVQLALPEQCFPITYAVTTPPATVSTAAGVSLRVAGDAVELYDVTAATNRYICAFDAKTLRFRDSPYGEGLLFGRGYELGVHGEWPVLSVSVRGTPVVPAARTVNGKALNSDVTLTGADIAVSGTDATRIDDALVARVSANDFIQATNALSEAISGKADAEPFLFAKYYPDGSVKSAAEFTPNIKYDDPDTINRTITVMPFCDTGDTDSDNSSLVGRVVIPPFVDEDGNGYISNDGTRYKVVGISGANSETFNTHLTAIIAPNTMTTIGDDAFYFCSALTSVSLPAATSIGVNAFYFCSMLTSVDFGGTPRSSVPTLDADAFYGVQTSCTIIVPYTQYDAWIAADGWRDLPQEFVRHAEKADKPATFTAGNLAEFDANGNPVDSFIAATNIALKTDISPTEPAFSNAVLAVGLGIDTNTVAVINDLVDSAHGFPLTGTASVGALLLALAAAIAALKRRKLDSLEAIAWSDLKAKRDGGSLVPGQQYRITDYVATTNGDMESRSANHPFDIIVTADDERTLNEHAKAIMHDGDLPDDIVDGETRTRYFAGCDLAAWDVWYCLDNDTSRFAWADTSTDESTGNPRGHGVVYRLVDEFQNDCPYDFKGIQFKPNYGTSVYCYTFDSGGSAGNTDLSLYGVDNSVYGNTIAPYYSDTGHDSGLKLNRIVFRGASCFFNTFGPGCYRNTFGSNCYRNTFGPYCFRNTFDSYCSHNTFSPFFYGNTFGQVCDENNFGANCYDNTFGATCAHNTFGPYCAGNRVGSAFVANQVGSGCSYNKFGSYFYDNTLGPGCSYIALQKSYCRCIRVGAGNRYLRINPTGTTSASLYYRNVEIKEGVNNTTDYKTIDDPNVGQTFLTTYKPADSQEVSL